MSMLDEGHTSGWVKEDPLERTQKLLNLGAERNAFLYWFFSALPDNLMADQIGYYTQYPENMSRNMVDTWTGWLARAEHGLK